LALLVGGGIYPVLFTVFVSQASVCGGAATTDCSKATLFDCLSA
jgi:hypothetical protein